MPEHDGMERLITEILLKHGFIEATSKPGLFFKELSPTATIYADFRRGRPEWYGFYNKTDRMPDEDVMELTKRTKQELSAIGMEPLEAFSQERIEPPPEAKAPPELICPNCQERMIPKAEFLTQLNLKAILYQCSACMWIEVKVRD